MPRRISSRRDQHFVGRVACDLLLGQMMHLPEHRRAPKIKDREFLGTPFLQLSDIDCSLPPHRKRAKHLLLCGRRMVRLMLRLGWYF
jgi:hypothetical protein